MANVQLLCGYCRAPVWLPYGGRGIWMWLLYNSYLASVQLTCGSSTGCGGIFMWLLYSSHVATIQLMCGSHKGWWGHFYVATIQLLCGYCTAVYLPCSSCVAPIQGSRGIPMWLPYSSHVANGQLLCGSHTGWGIPMWLLYNSHVAPVQLMCGSSTGWGDILMWLPYNSHVAPIQLMCGSLTGWWGHSHVAIIQLLCGYHTAPVWLPYSSHVVPILGGGGIPMWLLYSSPYGGDEPPKWNSSLLDIYVTIRSCEISRSRKWERYTLRPSFTSPKFTLICSWAHKKVCLHW